MLMQEVKNLLNTQEGSSEIQRILGRFEVLSKIVEDLGHVIAT